MLKHCKQVYAFVMHVWIQAGLPVEQGSVMFKAAATATAASAAFPPFCKMRMPACKQCHDSMIMGDESLLAKRCVHGCYIFCLSAAQIQLQTGCLVAAHSSRQTTTFKVGIQGEGFVCRSSIASTLVHFRETHKGLCTAFGMTRRHQ